MRKITNAELGRPTAEQFSQMEKMPVVVVLDNVRSAQNIGAFFRTGDAFAIERVCLCGITATPRRRARIIPATAPDNNTGPPQQSG